MKPAKLEDYKLPLGLCNYRFFEFGRLSVGYSKTRSVIGRLVILTSRDRPKSAPYPRLKNSKKTSKCQVFFFTVLKNRKFYETIFFRKNYILKKMDRVASRGPLARAPSALKGWHFRKYQHFCRSWGGFVAKHQKIEGGKNFIFGKKSHSAEKNWKEAWYVTRENRKNLSGSVR